MLVISRRPEETFVFPSLDVTVKVLKIKGGAAKIGIAAPRELEILRGEVSPEPKSTPPPAGSAGLHDLRNRLNAAKLAGHLAQRQISLGDFEAAEDTVEKMLSTFADAERMMDNAGQAEVSALLVDDDRNERELLAAYMKSFGYTVNTVGDGIAAMEYLQDNDSPDIVLLDMAMPRCDGPRTLRHIRETPSLAELPVYAVSGSEPQDVGISIGGPNGVNGWFAKPLNPEQLVTQLRRQSTLPQVMV